jgi:hypothetical protein
MKQLLFLGIAGAALLAGCASLPDEEVEGASERNEDRVAVTDTASTERGDRSSIGPLRAPHQCDTLAQSHCDTNHASSAFCGTWPGFAASIPCECHIASSYVSASGYCVYSYTIIPSY